MAFESRRTQPFVMLPSWCLQHCTAASLCLRNSWTYVCCAKTRVIGKLFVCLMATCGLPAGLHIFIQARPDVVILEVGIGGRIDATNIVKRTTVTGTRLHAQRSGAWQGRAEGCERMTTVA